MNLKRFLYKPCNHTDYRGMDGSHRYGNALVRRVGVPVQAEDADKAAERAHAAQGQRAEALSRLRDVHRRKARHLKDSVEAVQQVSAKALACACCFSSWEGGILCFLFCEALQLNRDVILFYDRRDFSVARLIALCMCTVGSC